MFTGTAPQEAIQLNEEGLERPADMPEGMYEAISGAMSFNRKDRPESISAFLTELSKNLPTPVPQEITPKAEREEVMEVEIEPEPEAVSTQEEEVAVQEVEPEAEQKPEIKVEEPTEEPPAPRRTFVEIVTDEYPEDEVQEEEDPEEVIEAEVAEAEREEEYVEEREEEESERTTPVETYDHVYETEQRRRINHWDWISGLVVIGVTVAVIFAIVYYLGEQEEEEAVVNENIKIDEDGMVTPLDSVAEVNQNDVPEAIVPTESVTPVAEPVAPVPASQNQVVPAAPQAVTPQKTPAPQAKEEATAQPKETKATPQETPKPKEAPAAQPKPQENKPAEPSAPAATPAPSQEKPSEPTPDAGASN